jgi:hypothetical protein
LFEHRLAIFADDRRAICDDDRRAICDDDRRAICDDDDRRAICDDDDRQAICDDDRLVIFDDGDRQAICNDRKANFVSLLISFLFIYFFLFTPRTKHSQLPLELAKCDLFVFLLLLLSGTALVQPLSSALPLRDRR